MRRETTKASALLQEAHQSPPFAPVVLLRASLDICKLNREAMRPKIGFNKSRGYCLGPTTTEKPCRRSAARITAQPQEPVGDREWWMLANSPPKLSQAFQTRRAPRETG